MSKAQITITWNPEREEETRVKLSDTWCALNHVEKIDNLMDAISYLEHVHDVCLKANRKMLAKDK